MSRRAALVVLLVVAALVAAGCGKSSSSGGGNGLDEALSFMPKQAPLVAAVETNSSAAQVSQLKKLVDKFPFSDMVTEQLKQSLAQSGNFDFNRDLKPVLGNDLVVAIETPQQFAQSNPPALVALKAEDQGKARTLLQKDATKVGSAQGTDIYKESGQTYLALKDGVIVFASSQPQLEAALARHSGGDHMTAADFDTLSAGLTQDALARIGLNLQTVIAASPNSAKAQQVKFVSALRNLGANVTAQGDGLHIDFKVTLAGPLQPQDLPLATGSQSPELVRRAGELGFGLRDPAQSIRFAEAAASVADPRKYATFAKNKATIEKQLGVNIDRDLVGQFEGDAVMSVSLDGKVGVRAKLKDPAAFAATLKKLAPKLDKIDPGKHLGVSTPKGGRGFYAIAKPDGSSVVFGVIGGNFVLATDAARAAQIAGAPTSPVAGAQGALAMALDTRSIANLVLQKRGQGGAAALVTGALGDFTGSVDAEPSSITGSFRQSVR